MPISPHLFGDWQGGVHDVVVCTRLMGVIIAIRGCSPLQRISSGDNVDILVKPSVRGLLSMGELMSALVEAL